MDIIKKGSFNKRIRFLTAQRIKGIQEILKE